MRNPHPYLIAMMIMLFLDAILVIGGFLVVREIVKAIF